MSEPKTLIAVKTGFYNGKRVREGEKFEFAGVKNPKWAVDAEAFAPVAKKPAFKGDTKPEAAAKAAAKKASDAQALA